MSLYTLICLVGQRLNEESTIIPEKSAWYAKEVVTFSDVLKAVRMVLWKENVFFRKEFLDPSVQIYLHDEKLQETLRNLLAKILA